MCDQFRTVQGRLYKQECFLLFSLFFQIFFIFFTFLTFSLFYPFSYPPSSHLTPNDDPTTPTPQTPLLRPSINTTNSTNSNFGSTQTKRTELVSVFEVDEEKLECKRNYAHNCISPISIIKFMADYREI